MKYLYMKYKTIKPISGHMYSFQALMCLILMADNFIIKIK